MTLQVRVARWRFHQLQRRARRAETNTPERPGTAREAPSGTAYQEVQPGARHTSLAVIPSAAPELEQHRRQYATRQARDAAIVALGEQLMPPHQIEQRIEVSRETIYVVLAKARDSGAAIPFFTTAGEPKGRAPARRAIAGDLVIDIEAQP